MVRLTDRPDMTLDVYRGHKTTQQQQQPRGHTYFPACAVNQAHQLYMQKLLATEMSQQATEILTGVLAQRTVINNSISYLYCLLATTLHSTGSVNSTGKQIGNTHMLLCM